MQFHTLSSWGTWLHLVLDWSLRSGLVHLTHPLMTWVLRFTQTRNYQCIPTRRTISDLFWTMHHCLWKGFLVVRNIQRMAFVRSTPFFVGSLFWRRMRCTSIHVLGITPLTDRLEMGGLSNLRCCVQRNRMTGSIGRWPVSVCIPCYSVVLVSTS